jgi:tetratricopeptide (TPR) repeat protein
MQPATLLLFSALIVRLATAQDIHNHPAPEKLGSVSFPTSCAPAVQQQFERAVALLHSFAYAPAEGAFREAAAADPHCAMAHWGIAMTYFHQLWEPPLSPEKVTTGAQEIETAQRLSSNLRLAENRGLIGVSERERRFIAALGLVFNDYATVPYRARALRYEEAMLAIAQANSSDPESQVFYSLALLSTALPADKTHANQKRASSLLEPLYRQFPDHPGIAHYLIHAYDNAELARRGVEVAHAYAEIAPSAPHALHMPSHIFTRLGMWDDSIASNRAARKAAHEQHDRGEELHAMDYLVYAYLQEGRDADAAHVIDDLRRSADLNASDFKAGYASTAMPVRYALERRQWTEAARMSPPPVGAPHIAAIAVWAQILGLARGGHAVEATAQIPKLRRLAAQLRSAGNDYWATQIDIQADEAQAWCAQAAGKPEQALALLRKAADSEDAIEKLPVTPGPIIPAREQLGDLLLEQSQPALAAVEFQTALKDAPGRRGALRGAAQAAKLTRIANARP